MPMQNNLIVGRKIDGQTRAVKVDNSGALDVYLQDQTTNAHSFYFKQFQNTVTLASNFAVNTRVATFSAGHGFVAGNYTAIIQNGQPYQGRVLNVAGNDITFDTPSPITYTTGATAARTVIQMNVNGGATPQIFNINPIQSAVWDVVRVTFLIEDDAAMDTHTFGGIAALTNGVVFRKKVSANEYVNYFTVKTNGEFEVNSGEVNYQAKAPAGAFGFVSKHTFGGQDHFGVVIRLNGSKGEELQVVIQDDLTTVTKFNATVQLHEVLD